MSKISWDIIMHAVWSYLNIKVLKIYSNPYTLNIQIEIIDYFKFKFEEKKLKGNKWQINSAL